MDWYVVRKDYVSYLSQFDKTVGFVDYGEKLKIHVETILTIGDFKYYVPISSAKPKHQNMSNSLDFHKLHHGHFKRQSPKAIQKMFAVS